MTKQYLAPALLLTAALLQAAGPAPQTAKVEGGLIQGTSEGGLSVYKGIPFAAPPTGELRWKPPQPAKPWQGTRSATGFAPQCMQGGSAPPNGMSEDCLYLNVWTPAKSPRERVPVLVWIYGGGFSGGATSVPDYSGEKLAARGVVLVSIAYRVGMFGFFAHPELSAESAHRVSGNYGLLDMIEGLRWVQRNIAAFGGDPKKVTIFGESAGGIAVSMLCSSPLAKGLFHGAISQSGGSFGPFSKNPSPGENMRVLADSEASGAELAGRVGAQSIAGLRALSSTQIMDALRNQRGMSWPIVDGWVIPDDQHRLYEAKRFNDTPILVGYNSDEGASFTQAGTAADYIAGVRRRYGPFAEQLIQAYPVSGDTVPKSARDLARDSAFGWHTWTWAHLQSRLGKGKVYSYYFDQHPAVSPVPAQPDRGSPHGAEIVYDFEHLKPERKYPAEGDERISEAMATYWTNFAKHGNPTDQGYLRGRHSVNAIRR